MCFFIVYFAETHPQRCQSLPQTTLLDPPLPSLQSLQSHLLTSITSYDCKFESSGGNDAFIYSTDLKIRDVKEIGHRNYHHIRRKTSTAGHCYLPENLCNRDMNAKVA